ERVHVDVAGPIDGAGLRLPAGDRAAVAVGITRLARGHLHEVQVIVAGHVAEVVLDDDRVGACLPGAGGLETGDGGVGRVRRGVDDARTVGGVDLHVRTDGAGRVGVAHRDVERVVRGRGEGEDVDVARAVDRADLRLPAGDRPAVAVAVGGLRG